MSYIGNPIISTDFPKDTFSGNGSTTAFTMSIAPASVNAVIVVVSGITQDPSTYTISGTTLTFSGAPPTGTSNISVRHLGVAGTPNVPATGSVTASSLASGNYFSQWTTTGSDIYYNTGNIGVGTSSPASFGKIAAVGGTVAVANTGIDGTTGVCYALQNSGYGTTYQNTIDGSVSSTYSASVIAFKLASGANTTTESMRIEGQNLKFNSGYGSVATAYGCRAWVNFNGTSTVAIRGSGNVSSITDNGTGDYTVNITTALVDANYSSFAFGKQTTGTTVGGAGIEGTSPATTSLRILTADANYNAADFVYVSVSIFR